MFSVGGLYSPLDDDFEDITPRVAREGSIGFGYRSGDANKMAPSWGGYYSKIIILTFFLQFAQY